MHVEEQRRQRLEIQMEGSEHIARKGEKDANMQETSTIQQRGEVELADNAGVMRVRVSCRSDRRLRNDSGRNKEGLASTQRACHDGQTEEVKYDKGMFWQRRGFKEQHGSCLSMEEKCCVRVFWRRGLRNSKKEWQQGFNFFRNGIVNPKTQAVNQSAKMVAENLFKSTRTYLRIS